MKACSIHIFRFLRTAAMLGLLFLAVGYTSNVNAAQGCGFGRHVSVYGGCIRNHPGAFSTQYNGHCWRNFWGALRCY